MICTHCTGSSTIVNVFDMFSRVFTNLSWAEDVTEQMPVHQVSDILAMVIEINMHHACSYHRRIVNVLAEFQRARSHSRSGRASTA